jgi:hypothetical protein
MTLLITSTLEADKPNVDRPADRPRHERPEADRLDRQQDAASITGVLALAVGTTFQIAET